MNPLDAELLPARDLVGGFLDLDPADDDGLRVDYLHASVPVELRVDTDDDGVVSIAISPPRQPIVTTVMPVFHRLSLTVVPRADD